MECYLATEVSKGLSREAIFEQRPGRTNGATFWKQRIGVQRRTGAKGLERNCLWKNLWTLRRSLRLECGERGKNQMRQHAEAKARVIQPGELTARL